MNMSEVRAYGYAAFEHAQTIWFKQNGCRYWPLFFLLHQP